MIGSDVAEVAPRAVGVEAPAMLEVNALVVQYGKTTALRGVEFSVREGEALFIVGPNGAGKSTILKTISGLLKPAKGEIWFDGRRVDGSAPENLSRAGLSLVPEGRHIFGTLTVRENLRVAATGVPRSRRSGNSEGIFDLFPRLRERLGQPAAYLSGGEQQQLAIARALLQNPKLLMVDEPSLGLAPLVIDQVYETLSALKAKGVTLLVVEQNSARLAHLADRVHVLNTGRITSTLNADSLHDDEVFRTAYFGF
jgi:branched-chain amino acid transport system ATP-binding protein